MKTTTIPFSASLLLVFLLASCGSGDLKNATTGFGYKGPSVIHLSDSRLMEEVRLDSVSFAVTVNGLEYRSDSLAAGKVTLSDSSRTTVYTAGPFKLTLMEELRHNWTFVSRQLFIESSGKENFQVNRIELFSGTIKNPVKEVFRLTGGKYGLAVRLQTIGSAGKGEGFFMLIQNPFAKYVADGQRVTLSYDPQMWWNPADGPFPSDRLCIGGYPLSGVTYRQDMAAEWVYEPDPAGFLAGGDRVDMAEMDAVTDCARAFLIGQPQPGVRVHVGWCENDYQIDMAKPEGRAEYKRMIDQAAATGCNYVLYTPDHSTLASLDKNTDAWGWESLLFLNLGQKVRLGEWVPGRDPLPEDIKEILDYAKSRNIKLLAYAYPSLPFMQDPEWTAWRTRIGQKPEGYLTVDTGLKSYQDWWLDLLVRFYKATGIGGYSFDHWWMNYTDEAGLVTSKYQQWFGTRRILEELRKREPEMIVDGRQQYHVFGTWTWLAGTYPHPLMSDEQPGSFNAFPDLSTDRVTAGRQRWVAWRLMTRDFTPVEIRPGFITHQTQRDDAKRVMRRDRFRTRDWDYLGWKFNLIASVATAPFNHVVNYLPARDEQEFEAFSDADKQFFRQWMDFTDQNRELLLHIRPIIGQPMMGRCDGTSAIVDNQGYFFVFNPNYRRMDAEFVLDESVGITGEGSYLLSELFPVEGLHPGQPERGFYQKGDRVSLPMDGVTARVLRIEPVRTGAEAPVLFNCTGKVALEGDKLSITGATGLVGETAGLIIGLPSEIKIKALDINGLDISFTQNGPIITASVTFDGTDFRQAQQLGSYQADFTGTEVVEQLNIPARIFTQLENRRKNWPVDYTEDDRIAPWLEPSRLLLYVQIAEPYHDRMVGDAMRKVPIRATELSMLIDGAKVDLKEAYNGVYPYVERTNLGFYADISRLATDVNHEVRVLLPTGLKPGQFQGIFIDHVVSEYTTKIRK